MNPMPLGRLPGSTRDVRSVSLPASPGDKRVDEVTQSDRFGVGSASIRSSRTDSVRASARPNHVYRYDRATGERLGTLLVATSGGIFGGTFLSIVPSAQAAVDASQIGTQYWVPGSGPTGPKRLDAEMVSANGGVFGSAFDPQTVVRKRWGLLSMQFTACDRASFSIDASGADSAGFGTLSYTMVRLVDSDATLRCRAEGFDGVSGKDWMSGAWYGLERSGEGAVVEIGADGIAVASFYTHVPDGY